MSDSGIHTEKTELIANIERHFEQLKSTVLLPPPDLISTDAPRFENMSVEYATTLATVIKEVAYFYGMNPARLTVTIKVPKTPDEQQLAALQKRIVELHKMFFEFLKEHDMIGNFAVKNRYAKIRISEHGILPELPRKERKTKSRIRFEEATWD